MTETFDVVTVKRAVESGRLDAKAVIIQIDNRLKQLNNELEEAKASVENARNVKSDFLGLGSKGRCEALANALTKTNETIASTNELIRGVISLVLCSADFAYKLIQASTELLSGGVRDANGRTVHVSEKTKEFIKGVIEIAKSLVQTQTELKDSVVTTKNELKEDVSSLHTKVESLQKE